MFRGCAGPRLTTALDGTIPVGETFLEAFDLGISGISCGLRGTCTVGVVNLLCDSSDPFVIRPVPIAAPIPASIATTIAVTPTIAASIAAIAPPPWFFAAAVLPSGVCE